MEKEGRSVIKRHAFGMTSGVDGCLQWLDEGSLMYPSGKTVVLHNIDSNTQRFFEASNQSTAITAMTVSANRKFIAIAEAGTVPQIQIIDSVTRKRRKILNVLESIQSDRFVCMSFSADGRHLVTQGGGPGWHLLYWNRERSKPLAAVSLSFVHDTNIAITSGEEDMGGTLEVWGKGSQQKSGFSSPSTFGRAQGAAGGGPLEAGNMHGMASSRGSPGRNSLPSSFAASTPPLVTHVEVCPVDPLLLTISGAGIMRYYQYRDAMLTPVAINGLPRETQEVFTTHMWMPGGKRLVAATQRGELLLIANGMYICKIPVPPGEGASFLASPPAFSTLSPTRHGFVAGADNGLLCIFSSNAELHQYINSPSITPSKITGATNVTATAGGHSPLLSSQLAAGVNGKGGAAVGMMAPLGRASTKRDGEMESAGSPSPSSKASEDANGKSPQGSNAIHPPNGDAADDEQSVAATAVAGNGVNRINGFDAGADEDLNFSCVYQLKVPKRDPAEDGEQDGTPQLRTDRAYSITGGSTSSIIARTESIFSTNAREEEVTGEGPGGSFSCRGSQQISGITGDGNGDGQNDSENRQSNTLSATSNKNGEESSGGAKKMFTINGAGAEGTSGEDGVKNGFRKEGFAAMASTLPDADKHRAAVKAEEVVMETQRHHTRLPYGIVAVALDQGENHLALATHAGRVFGFTFQQDWVTMSKEKEPEMEAICQRLHTGRINGMDCSVRKPFLITSSSDGSVRVWNTSTNKLEICTYFPQEPGAVAIHPNGLMAAICFPTKVSVMNILWSCLRDRRDINFRNATLVRFSVGGQYLAVVHGNLIDIFYSTTCELCGQLRGHPQKIRDMKWCATSPYPTDNRLITCSSDGMILDWNMTEMRKETEHFEKRFQYIAIASDDRNVWVVGAPTSATALEAYWKVTLREMDRTAVDTVNGCASEDYEFTETTIQQLLVAPHQRLLLGGCDDGCLKMMPFPLQSGVQFPPITAHAGGVTQMCLSFDEATLFTGSEDGTFFVWSIREEGGGRIKSGQHDPKILADEVLVTSQELDEKKIEMEVLQQMIERLRTDLDSEEKRRNHEQGTRLRERTEEFKSEVAGLAAQYAALWNAKSEQERSFVTIKLEKDTDSNREMEQLERTKQSEVEQLEEECDALQNTLESERVMHAEQLKDLEKQVEMRSAEDTAHFNDVLSQRKETMDKLSRQLERSQQTNTESIRQLELDTDAELVGVSEKHNATLSTLRERFLRMKGEGAIMRKNAARMEKEIEVRTNEIRLLDQAKAALTMQLGELSHRMSQLHQDIDERDVVIGDREKAIYALKKQNQELEKHKFVLDHRIRQLKAQMEPKQREIVYHNQKITQKNSELESFHSNNITLLAKIEDLKKDLIQQREQRSIWINKNKDFETYKKRFQKDVTDLIPAIQEPPLMKAAIDKIYQAHFVSRHGQRISQADSSIQHEFSDQIGYLSTSVEALSHKVKADQLRHKKEVADMMMENLSLIREIHDLREEIQELRALIAADEASKRSPFEVSQKKGRGGAAGPAGGRWRRFPARSSLSISPSSQNTGVGEERNTPPGILISGGQQNFSGSTASAAMGKQSSNSHPFLTKGVVSSVGGGVAMTRSSSPSIGTSNSAGGGVGNGVPTVGGVSGNSRRFVGTYQSDIPDRPPIIEANKAEIQLLRSYVDAMERTLGTNMIRQKGGFSVLRSGLKEGQSSSGSGVQSSPATTVGNNAEGTGLQLPPLSSSPSYSIPEGNELRASGNEMNTTSGQLTLPSEEGVPSKLSQSTRNSEDVTTSLPALVEAKNAVSEEIEE